MQNIAYVDFSNLIISSENENLRFDLVRFFIYLRLKFEINSCFVFTPQFKKFEKEFDELKKLGVTFIYKNSYRENNKLKANCDVEISHHITKHIKEMMISRLVLVSGDGDFSCILDYANNLFIDTRLFAIHPNNTSKLLKTRKYLRTVYLCDVLLNIIKGKAPANHERLEGVLFGNSSISDSKNLSNLSQENRRKAEKILQDNNILDILAKFGEVRVGGSFYTNLMSNNNDIDISIISNNKRQSSLEFVKYISEQRLFQKYEYGDFEKFPRKNRTQDFIIVLKIEHNNEKWEVEIWFKESLDKNMIELEERLLNLDEDIRLQILKEKFERDRSSNKFEKSSYEIYQKYLN